ncbi:MAG TPA: hypothetical protein PLL00_02235 [Bacteroidia bacterium]|jgi:hypothetical protein|nr:hypothetical protein [Bacteroidia bacterium]
MEIFIHDSYKLSEIQEVFSEHFPYLKLEFFNVDPTKDKIFSKENLITQTNKTLAELRHVHRKGHLSINGHQKVSTLESHFANDFGIYTQVFRKSGDTWLQTTSTDEWTLSQQNNMAKEMEASLSEKNETDNKLVS